MKLTQPSFTGGELAPALYARTDLQRYANSLQTCRNFIVSSYGGVYNRPGTTYITDTKGDGACRLIPFSFNTEQNYVLELGANYARFYANGAPVMSGGSPVEIATPWGAGDIWSVRYTQSADVMYLTHPNYPPQTISRTSAATFVIAPFVVFEGPFQPTNGNAATMMAASATTGNVTVTCNTAGTFNASMVGQLLYLQNQNFQNLKPWASGEKNVAMGSYRVNDGITYQAIQASTGGTYVLCGGNAPQHDRGAQWDGPGDVRSDGTNTYTDGVLWQYVDSGYGIVKITGYTNDTTVTGTVTRTLPQGIIGGAGTPAHAWSLTGDGSTITFPIAGNVSALTGNYSVTIGGVIVQSDPNYLPPSGGGSGTGGGCLAVDQVMPGGLLAGLVFAGGTIEGTYGNLVTHRFNVQDARLSLQPCRRLVTESGATVTASDSTPMTLPGGALCMLPGMLGQLVAVRRDAWWRRLVGLPRTRWERVTRLTAVGDLWVNQMSIGGWCLWGGDRPGIYVSTHNNLALPK
jgi:hypothetical protein